MREVQITQTLFILTLLYLKDFINGFCVLVDGVAPKQRVEDELVNGDVLRLHVLQHSRRLRGLDVIASNKFCISFYCFQIYRQICVIFRTSNA